MPEQCGNSKPVGQSAHRGSFSERGYPAPPSLPAHAMTQQQRTQGHQQRQQRDTFHSPQGAGFFINWTHHESSKGKWMGPKPGYAFKITLEKPAQLHNDPCAHRRGLLCWLLNRRAGRDCALLLLACVPAIQRTPPVHVNRAKLLRLHRIWFSHPSKTGTRYNPCSFETPFFQTA